MRPQWRARRSTSALSAADALAVSAMQTTHSWALRIGMERGFAQTKQNLNDVDFLSGRGVGFGSDVTMCQSFLMYHYHHSAHLLIVRIFCIIPKSSIRGLK